MDAEALLPSVPIDKLAIPAVTEYVSVLPLGGTSKSLKSAFGTVILSVPAPVTMQLVEHGPVKGVVLAITVSDSPVTLKVNGLFIDRSDTTMTLCKRTVPDIE
jgi:hypothetical protein